MPKIYHLNRLFPDNTFRPDDEKIIENIIHSIHISDSVDIRDIAKRNFSSPATISRLAKRAGFNNYKEMIFFLSKSLTSVELQALEELPFVSTKDDLTVLETIFEDVFKDTRAYLYGEGFCQMLVDYVYRKLLLKKVYAINLDGVEIDLVSDGLPHHLFIFSQSGENKRGLTKIKECQEKGGKAVAFTATSNSSFSQAADFTFIVDSGPASLEQENQSLNLFYGNCLNLVEHLVHTYQQ